MLSPALTLAMYFLVFSVFLKNGIPNFVTFLFSGLVVWNMFLNSVVTGTGIIVDRAPLVKKVSFPREILPLSNVGAAMVYFVVQLGVLVLYLAVTGHAPDWQFLWLTPIVFVTLSLFAAALASVSAALTVYLRDIRHLMEVLLQLWFWLTPVVYSYENSISPALHRHGLAWLYFLNPLSILVLTFQRTFYVTTTVAATATHPMMHLLPTWSFAHYLVLNLALLAAGVVSFLVAESLFGRLEGNFESEL